MKIHIVHYLRHFQKLHLSFTLGETLNTYYFIDIIQKIIYGKRCLCSFLIVRVLNREVVSGVVPVSGITNKPLNT